MRLGTKLCLGIVLLASFPLAARADQVYAVTLGFTSEGFVTFDTATPGTRTQINAGLTDEIYGLTFDLTGTTLFAARDPDQVLGTINTATGIFTPLAGISGILVSHTITGLSINPLNGVMYLSTTGGLVSALYTLDPGTGVASLVGTTAVAQFVTDIAFAPDGTLFATDILTDSLYRLDPSNGNATLIGALGVGINFAQGMSFDSSGTLYAALYFGGGTGQWSTINTTTGAATSLAPLGVEMEIAIATTPVAPEPSTFALLLVGATGILLYRQRRRRQTV